MSEWTEALTGYELVVDERFGGSELDPGRWIPHYLPHWSGRERSRARYRLTGRLELFVAADQPPWRPDIEGSMRVSSLQTGGYAGPLGSGVGQHRTDERLTVVEEQPVQQLLTPTFGAIEMRARWTPHADGMFALWMIGFEDEPHRSAEICICEIFGRDVTDSSMAIGMGLHPFRDPSIVDDFEQVTLPLDVREPHDYAVIWTPKDVTFFVDGTPVKRVSQSPQYPMQLMLSVYDFSVERPQEDRAPLVVDHLLWSLARRA